jgi:Putative MetA-pathway of phenol degradation
MDNYFCVSRKMIDKSAFEFRSRRNVLQIALIILTGLGAAVLASAQQPFFTDNADVTEQGHFHVEATNEFDRLQSVAFPVKYQNGVRATLAYGLIKDVEVSIAGQFLYLISDADPRMTDGIGDTTFSVKYNFYKERKNSVLPALTIGSFVQFPTGSVRRGLGSGVRDIGINGIAQKTVREKNILRLNGGILFSGNTVNGAIGFSTVRGQVFTGGASFVHQINGKLQLGVELAGALSRTFQLDKGQLQSQFGGNYQFRKKTSFDFGFIVGRFAASPHLGLQAGFSHDF